MLETTPLYVKRVDLVVLCGATWETEWPSSFISQFFCSLLSNFLICLHAPFPLSLAGVLLLVLRTQLWITSFYFAARISWFISVWMQSVWTTDRRFRVLRGEACVELVSTDRVQVFSRSLVIVFTQSAVCSMWQVMLLTVQWQTPWCRGTPAPCTGRAGLSPAGQSPPLRLPRQLWPETASSRWRSSKFVSLATAPTWARTSNWSAVRRAGL